MIPVAGFLADILSVPTQPHLVVTKHSYGNVHLVDSTENTVLWEIDSAEVGDVGLSFSKDGRMLAVGGRGEGLLEPRPTAIYKTGSGELIKTLELLASVGTIQVVGFSTDDRKLIGQAIPDQPVAIWDLETGEVDQMLEAPPETLGHYSGRDRILSFSADGHLAYAVHSQWITIWNVETGAWIRNLGLETILGPSVYFRTIDSPVFSRDSRFLAFVTNEHVHVWDVEREELSLSIEPSLIPRRVTFSPDMRHLLIFAAGDDVRIRHPFWDYEGEFSKWRLGTGEQVATLRPASNIRLHATYEPVANFSQDGLRLYFLSGRGEWQGYYYGFETNEVLHWDLVW